jgi:hypothetical protein
MRLALAKNCTNRKRFEPKVASPGLQRIRSAAQKGAGPRSA